MFRLSREPRSVNPENSGRTLGVPVRLRIKGREKWYESTDAIQTDLDVFLEFYNLRRSHQGYRLKGRTPAQALREALGRKRLPPMLPKEDETVAKEAA